LLGVPQTEKFWEECLFGGDGDRGDCGVGLGDFVTSLNLEGDRESERLMVLAIDVASTRCGCVGDGSVIVPPLLEYDMVVSVECSTQPLPKVDSRISNTYRPCNIYVVSDRVVPVDMYIASGFGGLNRTPSLLSSVAN
jgi:hypothetical protein